MSISDLDQDGYPDIAISNVNEASVSILFGRCDGSLVRRSRYHTGLQPRAVASVDLNGDGLLDLVTANELGDATTLVGSISLLLNQGASPQP